MVFKLENGENMAVFVPIINFVFPEFMFLYAENIWVLFKFLCIISILSFDIYCSAIL